MRHLWKERGARPTERRFILIGVALGLALWLIESVFDRLFFFPDRSLVELILTDVPPHEIFIRSVGLILFIAFGFAVTHLSARRSRAEAAIRLNEEIYREAIENASGVPYRLRYSDGRYDFIGDGFDEIFGISPDQFTFGLFRDLVQEITVMEPGAPSDAYEYGRAFRRGEFPRYRADFRIVTPRGEEKWISDCSIPIHDKESGEVIGTLGILQDITARRQVEEALRNSEATLRSIFRSAPVGIGLVRDRVLCWVNDTLCEMVGHSREELESQSARILYDSDEEFERVGREKYAEIAREGTGTIETRWRRADGSLIDVLLSSTPIDPADLLAGVTFTALNITARRRAEADRARLATAIEQTAEAIVITGTDGAIQYINPAFTESTGYSIDEVLGNTPRILRSGRHDAAFYRDLWETITRGEVWSGHFINRRKDGSLIEEEATISPIRDESGEIVAFAAVERDVTREKELEAQLRQSQKMEAVGQLAGGIAHDFNNLILGVLGFTDLAIMSLDADHPSRADLEQVREAAEKAATLTRQLLAFSRRQLLQPEDLDLNAVIANLMRMIRRMIGEHIELEVIPGQSLGTVHADRGQVEQVLLNLCVNARDAMPAGGKITIETENVVFDSGHCLSHPWAKPGPHVLMTISDTGVGMDQATLGRIFEPFFTTKEMGRGTGLGLAMVYGIMRQHGGMIQAQSEPGMGTTFKLHFPVVERGAAEEEHRIKGPVHGGTETILIAEDERTVRELFRRILAGAGYTVLCAGNGEEALQIFHEHRDQINLALIDVVMPRLGGRAVCEHIRQARPDMRFLFTSGYSVDAIHTDFIKDRAIELLQKPLRPEELLRKIRTILDA
ncbi:PAS domain S-box protein [Candidatus Sumerlaeota bacterium]|nr:PAS domain S-box protein [Candidatus Sumerlaeota bacterium]